jgi:hypothetical protein
MSLKKTDSYSTVQEFINFGKFRPVICLISSLMCGTEQALVCQYMLYNYKESHLPHRERSLCRLGRQDCIYSLER